MGKKTKKNQVSRLWNKTENAAINYTSSLLAIKGY